MYLRPVVSLLVLAAACGSGPRPSPSSPGTPGEIEAHVAPGARRAAAEAKPLVRDAGASARCGAMSAKLDGDGSLLGDRLAVHVPKAAGELARQYDVMSSPKPIEEETRLMLGGGKSAGKAPGDDAFVVLAEELWQLDPDLVKAEADAIVHPGTLAEEAPKFLHAVYGAELDVEEVVVGDGTIRAFAGRPQHVQVKDGADAAMVLVLMLGLPDATLQTVAFWVTPGLARDAGCIGLAERVGATLAVGKRPLERAAGTRTLGDVGGKKLAVTLPANYTVVHQPGPDFDLYKVFHLRPLSLYPGHMHISVDAYPDRERLDGAVDEKGTLLGRATTWQARRSARGGVAVATEAIPGTRASLQVQVVATREAKVLDEFKKIAESLTLR